MITYFDINLKDINSFKVISAQENDKAIVFISNITK